MANHDTHVIQEFYCLECFSEAKHGKFGELAFRDKMFKATGDTFDSAQYARVRKEILHYHVRDLTSGGRTLIHEKYRTTEPAFKRANEIMMRYAYGGRSVHIQVDPCVGTGYHCRGIREE